MLFTGEDAGCDDDCVRHSTACLSTAFDVKQQHMRSVTEQQIAGAQVIVVPGGDVWPDSDDDDDDLGQLKALGAEGSAAVSRAVHEGAVYVGICAGAFLALEIEGLGLAEKLQIVDREIFGFEEQGHVKGSIRLSPATHAQPQLLKALGKALEDELWYDNGPLFVCKTEQDEDFSVLANYAGALDRDWSGVFGGMTQTQKKKVKKGWGNEGPKMDQKAAIVACRVGRGVVILMSPHPELSDGMEAVVPSLALAARAWADRL